MREYPGPARRLGNTGRMHGETSAAKVALRRRLLDRRRGLPDATIEAARAAVREAVLAVAVRAGWRVVAGYVPLRSEPGSTELLDALADRGIDVLVPILLPDRDLDWAAWQPGRQSPTGPVGLGVTAVAAADAVLVPALAVATDGTRLGRGGGSYDRALTRVRDGVPTAALVYDDEVLDALPGDRWDVRVSAVVTPGGGWRLLGPAAAAD